MNAAGGTEVDMEDNVAIDGAPANFLHDDASGNELGHDAVGTSPLATQSPPCHIPPLGGCQLYDPQVLPQCQVIPSPP